MRVKKTFNKILIGLGFFAFFNPVLAKEKLVQSTWAAEPAKIDALEEEWSGVALTSEEGVGANLAFRNDADNLYILFIIKNKDFLSTLEATGMTIYYDNLGKKKKDYGLRFFRRQISPDEFMQIIERRGQALSEEQKEEIRSKPSYILYDGELIEKKKISPLDTPLAAGHKPPAFMYARKGETTVFEFRIPLSREIHPAGIGVAAGGTFKIGFEWGGLTKEMQAARLARAAAASERSAERETASEDHARGSETGGFATSSPSSGLSRTGPKRYSFWLDVKLASGL
ncbi:MAG: hypothetical protein QHH14_06035 [Clostridiales bacterium]|nr:hypothetical protein [Clostridiales bacterium]